MSVVQFLAQASETPDWLQALIEQAALTQFGGVITIVVGVALHILGRRWESKLMKRLGIVAIAVGGLWLFSGPIAGAINLNS